MNIIRQLETHAMDIREVRKYLASHSKALLYETLSKSKNYLFKNHKCVIVLYESRKLKQGHYVALINRGKNVEYFSSLGMPPRDELTKLKLGESPKFQELLKNNFTYNRTALQNQSDYKINTCGWFCIARCLLYELSITEFVQLFKSRSKSPDEIIARMALLLKYSVS